jgi:hypothetical protein
MLRGFFFRMLTGHSCLEKVKNGWKLVLLR